MEKQQRLAQHREVKVWGRSHSLPAAVLVNMGLATGKTQVPQCCGQPRLHLSRLAGWGGRAGELWASTCAPDCRKQPESLYWQG